MTCGIWKLQKSIFANGLLEKKARNAVYTCENFGMKDITAVVDAYPHDEAMLEKPKKIFFQLDKEISIEEKGKLRLGLVKIPVALDGNN